MSQSIWFLDSHSFLSLYVYVFLEKATDSLSPIVHSLTFHTRFLSPSLVSFLSLMYSL